MSKNQDNHYKEASPVATVNKLSGILNEMGIEVTEDWQDVSCVGTYSLRVTINGTSLGTNGKGVTRDYARASAYAELIERYQNDLLCSFFVNAKEHSDMDFYFCPDEKILTAEEMLAQKDPFMNEYFAARDMLNASLEEKTEAFRKYNHPDITGQYNQYVCLPFFDLRTGKVYYLPKSTTIKFCGSNGMAAGNTPEEAIVQGLSEIFERVSQTRIFHEKPSLPDIPEDYIRQYPEIYNMYLKLKSMDGYEVFMKDCSFGGLFPVAALILVQKNTNKFGIKLGCHPDYGIAMERAFTEAAQGNDLTEYVNRSTLNYYNTNVDDSANIENSYKVGLATYPYEIFGSDSSYPFSEPVDVSMLSNREIMLKWIDGILSEGHDILIRNVSSLGFPSFHIIIPGMSEIKRRDDYALRVANTRSLTSNLMRHPSMITLKDVGFVQAVMGYYANRVLENGLSTFFPPSDEYDLPFEKYHCGNIYVCCLCDVMKRDYGSAAGKINSMYRVAEGYGADEDTLSVVRCMYSYLSGMDAVGDEDALIRFLRIFFDRKYIDETLCRLGDPERVFISNLGKTEELLESGTDRGLARLVEVVLKLKEAQVKNYIDQASMSALFETNVSR